jgi:predicted Zn-dependent protease
MKLKAVEALAAFAILCAIPAVAAGQVRLPGRDQIVKGATKVAQGAKSMNLTEEEKLKLGQDVSAMLRQKYGVVQDAAVHRYVSLVGTVLAQRSSMPKLKWTFIVLDTDGVNAFAAPHGFVHITRGALALIQNEAELAGVLGHEITHITAEHTVKAVNKSKWVDTVASATRIEFLNDLANKVYSITVENAFDKGDEQDCDRIGIALANTAGYKPDGLSGFLGRLAERNKDLKERSGVFASYPEMKSRLDDIAKTINSRSLTSAALVQPRYDQTINFTLVPIGKIEQVAPPEETVAKKEEPKKSSGRFGLGSIKDALGRENSSESTVASTGSRGVNPDRDAKGGPNKAVVVITLTAAQIEAFKKGIS